MEEMKNVNIEEINEVEETEMESKPEGFKSKVIGGFKRNGKKIAIGVAAVVGLGVAYALGKGSAGADEEDSDDVEDVDVIEIEFNEATEE